MIQIGRISSLETRSLCVVHWMMEEASGPRGHVTSFSSCVNYRWTTCNPSPTQAMAHSKCIYCEHSNADNYNFYPSYAQLSFQTIEFTSKRCLLKKLLLLWINLLTVRQYSVLWCNGRFATFWRRLQAIVNTIKYVRRNNGITKSLKL